MHKNEITSKESLLKILDLLDSIHIRYWVDGGWGVDILLGKQTREHRDIDIDFDGEHEKLLMSKLKETGYTVTTDWSPSRVELYHEEYGYIDIHPLQIAENGTAKQAMPEGGFYEFKAEWFSESVFEGRTVPCISIEAQKLFHSGYELRAVDKLDLAHLAALEERKNKDWFTIEQIDDNTFSISEYRHWEESHSYLLIGEKYSLLIDTGLGIENIKEQIDILTNKPVIAVATHIHWDHIGGHKYFPDFYAHEAEIGWLNGEFPLTIDQIKDYVVEDCDLPDDFDVEQYEFFQGMPSKILKDRDVIDIGGRQIEVLHTPGHSPGHMCFYEKDTEYLFTGDLVYIGTLFAYYPSTDPVAYLESIQKIAALSVKKIFPAHHNLNVPSTILTDMEQAFLELKAAEKLHHGSGTYDYGYFSIWL